MKKLVRNFRWAETGETQHMLVEDGIVVYRGPELPETDAEVEDQGGKWLLPLFVDCHCHILPTGLDLQKLNLGVAQSHQDVLDLIRTRHSTHPDGWLMAVHYDQNKYNGVHIHRDQLDAICPDRPVILRHVSGHASVLSSAALKAAHITEESGDPAGGAYVRDESGRLTGVLLEEAHDKATRSAPPPSLEAMVDAIMLAGDRMRALGIGCATDMMTGFFDLPTELEAYRLAAERGLKIDTRLFLQWSAVLGPRKTEAGLERVSGLKGDRCRVEGIKIFADGAIGSATAAIYGKFCGVHASGFKVARHSSKAKHPGGEEVDGQLIYSPSRLKKMVLAADEAGYRVAVHSIGDYCTDLVLDAIAQSSMPKQHRIEHAMILSDSQIERIAEVGCTLSFQPEFLTKLGHVYLRQLGPERTSVLKRSRSVLDAGIPLAFSSDRPIVSGDPWESIRAGAFRQDPYDPAENCTLAEAIQATTVWAAEANGDRDGYATLRPGSRADYQVFEELPIPRNYSS